MRMTALRIRTCVILTAAAIAVAACSGGTPGPQSRVEPAQGGPGMNRRPLEALPLPVSRTYDLTHVEAAHFAKALGKDPVRIFEFVRDNIAFEAYPGVLRGPRGTLLARAGNAVDRAALLAALLEAAGQQVRYARGVLSEADARALVQSMWAPRPAPSLPTPMGDRPESLRKIAGDVIPAVERFSTLLIDQLNKADRPAKVDLGPSLDALVAEARDHYWVQWQSEGKWVDMDPSTAQATQGKRLTDVVEVLDALKQDLFHKVVIRVTVEEAGDALSTRQLLAHTANAADLSGREVVLAHFPEEWAGPVASLEDAMSAAIQRTGQIKPVLIIGEQVVMGELFRQKPPTGLGGISTMLSGEGTRKPLNLAVAGTLEVEFTGPDGQSEKVRRVLFDTVGTAARRAAKAPTADEVRTRAEQSPDILENVYSLFFTTGRLDVEHLRGIAEESAPPDEPADVLLALRRLNIVYAALSDAFLPRASRPEEGLVIFYPDSPRLTVTELSSRDDVRRFVLDLRRDHTRAVVMGPRREMVLGARLLRGVVDGVLERALMEYVTVGLREDDDRWRNPLSTSAVFDRVAQEGIEVLLLPKALGKLQGIPEETMARLQEEIDSGYVLVAPQRAPTIDGVPRTAWWRVDPRTGTTVAVTDEGLHAVAVEYQVQRSKTKPVVRMRYREIVNGRPTAWRATRWMQEFSRQWDDVLEDFWHGMPSGGIGGPGIRLPTMWVP